MTALGERGLGGSTFVAERFFRSRDAAPAALENGFLPDPNGFMGKRLAGDVCTRGEIHEKPCSILLGEPGLGKSTTMLQRFAELTDESLFFDLRRVSAQEVLDAVRSAKAGPAHIVVDSVDEADLPSFPGRLLGELDRLPRGTIRLELACRASEWPETLQRGLPEIFGEKEVSYFRLDPLRRSDAASIVGAAAIDPESFLDAVYERGLGPLAAVPLTLELLMRVFRDDERFPHRANEIYEKALLHLCQENSPTRRDLERREVAPSRALAVAAQLATATVLGNRPRVTLVSPLLEKSGQLSVARVAPDFEDANEDVIGEVLQTGLFVHHSSETASFYHHSFAEFLTARWLNDSAFSAAQLRQLLFHHEAPDRLIPQLSGVATWLSCMNADMAALLARFAPETFIEADSPVATDTDRATAVASLMERAKARSLTRYWWPEASSIRLKHPGLAEQLKPYILATDIPPFLRRTAIDIARANGLSEFAGRFISIALDLHAAEGVRVEAIQAAFACAADPAAAAEHIRPLAEPGRDPSESDDIRAAVLSELWPRLIDSGELFRVLVPPRRGPIRGSYSHFIYRVANELRSVDLVTALTWAGRAARPHSDQGCREIEDLSEAIFLQAWAHLDDELCRRAYAKAAWLQLKVYRPVLGGHDREAEIKVMLEDPGPRRRLLKELAHIADKPDDVSFVVHPYGQPPFAVVGDIEWALEQRRGADDVHKPFWEHLVCRLLPWPQPVATLEMILEEVGDARESAMLPFPLWIDRESDEAKEAIKRQLKHQEWADEHAKRDEDARARRARAIEPGLRKANEGDPAGWFQAVRGMLNQRVANAPRDLLGALASETSPQEIPAEYLRLAKWYLETMPTDSEVWLRKKNTIWFAARAGYLSIRLVERLDPQWWNENARSLVARWAGAIVGFDVHALSQPSDVAAHRQLVEQLFLAHPSEGRRLVAMLLEREATDHPDLAPLDYLPPGTRVGDLLERCLYTGTKRIEDFQRIFDALVRFDVTGAIRFADGVLRVGNCSLRPSRPPFRSLSRWRPRSGLRNFRLAQSRRYSVYQYYVVLALLGVETSEAWKLVCRAALRYPGLGQAVAATFAGDFHSNWGGHIPDAGLAQLLNWLPRPTVSNDDAFNPLRSFRHGLLSRLAARGTPEAVRSLSEMEEADATDGVVQGAAADARERYCELSWQPTDPTELFTLRRSVTSRLVQSSEHLLGIVTEVIDRYAEGLHGKPPAVVDLWNETRTRKPEPVEYYPKDELALSDHLKRHLLPIMRGVVINREVEISPTVVERGSGENVDLLIQAVCPTTHREWSVVIEVKGSWNAQLLTHLNEQLRKRYLSSNALTCGIYLAGWYACAAWTGTDWRRAATRRHNRDEVAKLLSEQAIAASTGGRTVRFQMLDLTLGKG